MKRSLYKLSIILVFLQMTFVKMNNPPHLELDVSIAKFKVIKNGNSNRKFIWLHGDEKTAKMALEYHIKRYPGTAYLIENDSREINIRDGIIDPNRIFSKAGAKKNLNKYNPYWSRNKKKTVLDSISSARTILFKELFSDQESIVISLHNNYKGYNIRSEINNSDEISIKKNQNPRDFFLCTNENDYNILAKSPFNAVLQKSTPSTDDGSLSWAALGKKTRYINIETRLGWLSVQKKMLKYLEENIP